MTSITESNAVEHSRTATDNRPPPPTALPPNLFEAERFLTTLDPFETEWTFQTFTDSKPTPNPDPLARVIIGSLDDVAAQLERLNNRGAGVFVTVNQTDGRGRKKENITAIRALWQEADRGDEPELPVEPHLVVRTSRGKRHRYILVRGAPLEEFEAAQQVLVDHYGSDPAAKDRGRVLRLPGFWHVKDRENPQMVRLVHESGADLVEWEDLIKALPKPAPTGTSGSVGENGGWDGNVRGWPKNRPEIESALGVLDPDMSYEKWLAVGMALHQESDGDEEALDLWDDWSSGSDTKYVQGLCARKWAGFEPRQINGTTVRTLFGMAHSAGWGGWKVPSLVERLREQVEGLNSDTRPGAIEALVKEVTRLGPIDQERLLQGMKDRTGISINTLRKAGRKRRSDEGDEVDQLDLAKGIHQAVGYDNLIGQESGIWVYRENAGIWRLLSSREERQLVQNHLEDAKAAGRVEGISKSLVDGVTDLLKSAVHREGHEWDLGADDAVSTPGGVLVLDDNFNWVLRPHRREDYRTVQVPTVWNAKAGCPRFDRFLQEIFAPDGEAAGEKAQALLEMMGYTLMAHARHEKFIILVGEGSNGKSVLLSVLERLLGSDNVAGVQPSQFDRSFQRAHLHLKLANIVTEVRQGEVIADAELKAITSGETSTVEHKFRNPFNLKPYSTCWFGTNHLPHTRDFSDALFRRALVFKFNRRFIAGKDADPNLKLALFRELPGILRRSLEAYAQALSTGKFTEPQECLEARKAWRMEADQAAQFIHECCGGSTKDTKSTDIYQAYIDWAYEQGIHQKLSLRSLHERLGRLGYPRTRKKDGFWVSGLEIVPF